MKPKSDTKTVTLKVTFNGVEHVGVADTARSLLENIEAMRLPILSSCWRGLCGSCRVKLIDGSLDPENQLVEDDYVLSCSSNLSSDAHVVVSY